MRNSAAFGRAAHLQFGEAIVSATEGLRQENSILVDNAGITTNVAKMWENYAKIIGTTSDKLTTSQKIEAEMIGIREEASISMGNYEKMLLTASGKEAQFNSTLRKTKETIGTTLLPAYKTLISTGTELLNVVSWLTTVYQKWGAVVASNMARINAVFSKKIFNPAELKKEFEEIKEIYEQQISEINDLGSGASGIRINDKKLNGKEKEQDDARKEKEEKEKARKQAEELEKIEADKVENELLSNKNSLMNLEISLEQKLISYEEYAKKAKAILKSIDEGDAIVTENKLKEISKVINDPRLNKEQKASSELKSSKLTEDRLKNKLNYVKNINNIDEKLSGKKTGSKSSSSYSIDYKANYLSQLNNNDTEDFRRNNRNQVNLNQEKFDDFLVTAEEFYKKKNDLANEYYAYEINLLNKQKQELDKIKPKNEQERFNKLTEIAKITGDINSLEDAKLNTLRSLTREQEKYNELKKKAKELTDNELNAMKSMLSIDVDSDKTNTAQSLGLITEEQSIQAEMHYADKRYEIQKDLLNKNKDLYNENSEEYKDYLNKLNQLDVEYSAEKMRNTTALQASQLQQTMNMIKIFEDGFIDIAQSATKGVDGIIDAFKRMGNAIMMELIAVEAKIMARKVLSSLFGVSLDGNQAQPGGVLGIANIGRQNNPTSLSQSLLGGMGGILSGAGTTNNMGGNTTNNNNVTQNINIQGNMGGGDKSTLSQIFGGIGNAITKAIGSIN